MESWVGFSRVVMVSACLSEALSAGGLGQSSLEVIGLSVTPHVKADSMRYRTDPEPLAGARVQIFLRCALAPGETPLDLRADTRILFAGRTPSECLESKDWAWHDTPTATPEEMVSLPPGCLTVWSFNGRRAPFGPGGRVRMEVGPEGSDWLSQDLALDAPSCWLSAVTFLGPESSFQPDTLMVHVANATPSPLTLRSCRLWLPRDPKQPRVLIPQPAIQGIQCFNGCSTIPAGEHGGFKAETGPLPLTYAAIEVILAGPGSESFSIWGHVRIKTERFDISGGWVNGQDMVTQEAFLKTLKRLHVNTAHLALTPGYSDTPLYDRYPLKYFNALKPFEVYDTDAMLPKIHAAEFLGEPQYGGGKPVPPQEVWTQLHPYAVTRLATTLTNSEERVWRDYAGLSDFPHYDAYRITAPSADYWLRYERWDGQRIGWGAPLETIGDMCRSMRELNRPVPCAIWSQGPHDGWNMRDGRKRATPTPEEMRSQCYHALSTRITSLYWFNLSLKSLVQWRDTLDELTRLGREMRLLDSFLLEGDATYFGRESGAKDRLDWDLSVVSSPRAALLFALDLRYEPDLVERVFRFGPARKARWRFPVPSYLQGITDVFRLDSDGIHEVQWRLRKGAVSITDRATCVGVYIATKDSGLRGALEARRQSLIQEEDALGFDPARVDQDYAVLQRLLEAK